MARQARVSLCMIVRDEERNLAQCLSPLAELFDEIIIVDTGSLDDTKKIARQFTPRVYDFAWCDDFSAARNECLRHATGDWIFWLDADDRIEPEQVSRLRDLLAQLDGRPQAIMIDTVLPSVETNDEERTVTHPRLFRRHPDLRWQGRVHEQLEPAFATLGYEVRFADLVISHVGYLDRTIAERKGRRKLRLLRMDYAVDPNKTSTLLHLGIALARTRNTKEARGHLLRLIEIERGAPAYMRWVHDALAQLAMGEGRMAEAVQIAERGLATFPGDENLLLAQAAALYAMEDYVSAGRVLQLLMGTEPNRHMTFCAPRNATTKLAPRMLGTVLRMQGAYLEAEAVLRQVLRDFPTDRSTWYNLGLVYLDQGRGQLLAQVIQQLAALDGGAVDAGLLAALWHMRYGDVSLAGPIIDDLISKAPLLAQPRMLRAEWLSRVRAPLDSQIRALRDILRVQPGNLEALQWISAVEQIQAAQIRPPQVAWSTTVVETPGAAAG